MTVAIVGPGTIGAAHARAWRRVGAEVSHLVSRRPDAALADAPHARTVTDLAEALADPGVDIVTICTPTPTHRAYAEASLRAGRNVLLEKPMALRVDDAVAIAAEARACACVLMVAHVVRFFPAYERVRELVAGGVVGRVLHVRAERMIAAPDTPWWYDDEQSGGVVVDLGIHDLDQANLMLGRPIDVRAVATDALGPVETTVRYEAGLAQVLSHARMPVATSFATALQVVGDAGVVSTRHLGGEHPMDEFAVRGAEIPPPGRPAELSDPYERQAAHFLQCVASGRPSAIAPVDDAVQALRTAIAARDSLRAGGAWMPVA